MAEVHSQDGEQTLARNRPFGKVKRPLPPTHSKKTESGDGLIRALEFISAQKDGPPCGDPSLLFHLHENSNQRPRTVGYQRSCHCEDWLRVCPEHAGLGAAAADLACVRFVFRGLFLFHDIPFVGFMKSIRKVCDSWSKSFTANHLIRYLVIITHGSEVRIVVLECRLPQGSARFTSRALKRDEFRGPSRAGWSQRSGRLSPKSKKRSGPTDHLRGKTLNLKAFRRTALSCDMDKYPGLGSCLSEISPFFPNPGITKRVCGCGRGRSSRQRRARCDR